MHPTFDYSESRRSFVKNTLATTMSMSLAGLIRAHGQQTGGETTTWNPYESTTSDEFTTIPPNDETTFETTFDTTVATTAPTEKWVLLCAQEPAEGEWGELFLDPTATHGASGIVTSLIDGIRSFTMAVAVTNRKHPSWFYRCIHAGACGRGTNPNPMSDGYAKFLWSRVCVAGVFVTDVLTPSGLPTRSILKPKQSVALTIDPATGLIGVNSSMGGIENGTAGGSPIEVRSMARVAGAGTRRVTLDVDWSFKWDGFTSAQINLVRNWLHFGMSANNEIRWERKTRFVFEGVRESELVEKRNLYLQQAPSPRVSEWTDESGTLRHETSPFGTYTNPVANLSALVNVDKITERVTALATGTKITHWEF